jgi:beta-glucosidase
MIRKILLFMLLALSFAACKQEKKEPVSVKTDSELEKKVNQLLSKMSLKEKIGQMNDIWCGNNGLTKDPIWINDSTEDIETLVRHGKVGCIVAEMDVPHMNALQKIAIEEGPSGIPLVFTNSLVHGYKTIFPLALAQSASFNPQLVEKNARLVAMEGTAAGYRWNTGPALNITRDPRWGRVGETYGEDPFLTSVMGVAVIKGMQGKNLSDSTSMAACASHYVGYGASESGLEYNTTWIPQLQMLETFMPPFEAAVKVGAATIRCSFNEINGTPSVANKFYNVDYLRNELHFDGVLTSCWGSIRQLKNQGVSPDLKNAAMKAVAAGVDMDEMSHAYSNELEKLVKSGAVSKNLVDSAVRNILRLKIRLGLFEHPYTNESKNSPFYKEATVEAAKQAAIESVILLKNQKNLLPLSDKIKTVAVIGPLSDAPADQLGSQCIFAEPENSITPLAAIKRVTGINVIAEKGLTFSRETSQAGIAAAVAAAKKAEVVLLFLGEEVFLSGEARSRANINLPGAQSLLLTELEKTGKPVVVVIMAGRPLTIPTEFEQADALLYSFFAGSQAGPALIDLIFGKASPSAKLPITLPRMVGQIPIYYGHKGMGRPAKTFELMDQVTVGKKSGALQNSSYYLDAGNGPLLPFGYGLSYTTFKYSKVKLSKAVISENESVWAECSITNTGKVEGKEVVQLYIQDEFASIARPVRELKGFKKIALKAGQTKTVKFKIGRSLLAYWTENHTRIVEPGDFKVWITSDSNSGVPVKFTVKYGNF